MDEISKTTECSFPRQTIQYHGNPSLCPSSNAEEAEVEWFYEDLQNLLELTPKKDVLFIIGDWNANVASQETPGVTGKFGLGIRNEAEQRLIEFCQENALVIANTLFPNTREDSTHEHHQMVNTEIRLIIFFAAKDTNRSTGGQISTWLLKGRSCPHCQPLQVSRPTRATGLTGPQRLLPAP